MTIFPAIVTTAYNHSFPNYLEKVKEAEALGIKELCFFPTALEKEERKKGKYQNFRKISLRLWPY